MYECDTLLHLCVPKDWSEDEILDYTLNNFEGENWEIDLNNIPCQYGNKHVLMGRKQDVRSVQAGEIRVEEYGSVRQEAG